MKPRLLDLFSGAGGSAMGYHRAGFEVVGVDIAPQAIECPHACLQDARLRGLREGAKGPVQEGRADQCAVSSLRGETSCRVQAPVLEQSGGASSLEGWTTRHLGRIRADRCGPERPHAGHGRRPGSRLRAQTCHRPGAWASSHKYRDCSPPQREQTGQPSREPEGHFPRGTFSRTSSGDRHAARQSAGARA